MCRSESEFRGSDWGYVHVTMPMCMWSEGNFWEQVLGVGLRLCTCDRVCVVRGWLSGAGLGVGLGLCTCDRVCVCGQRVSFGSKFWGSDSDSQTCTASAFTR